MLDGPEVDIKVKPHGNSKGSTPFYPTSKKTKDCIKALSKEVRPKEVVNSGEVLFNYHHNMV